MISSRNFLSGLTPPEKCALLRAMAEEYPGKAAVALRGAAFEIEMPYLDSLPKPSDMEILQFKEGKLVEVVTSYRDRYPQVCDTVSLSDIKRLFEYKSGRY